MNGCPDCPSLQHIADDALARLVASQEAAEYWKSQWNKQTSERDKAIADLAALEAEKSRLWTALEHCAQWMDSKAVTDTPQLNAALTAARETITALAASPAPSAWRETDSATEQCPHCLCPDKNQCGCEINA